MSILKELRESRNLTKQNLAGIVDTTVKNLGSWEKDFKSIPKNKLSHLAYYFGHSSEDLLGLLNGNLSKIMTTTYVPFSNKTYEDAWWGHVGLRLNNSDRTEWFPITLGTADRLSCAISCIESRKEWMVIETLNNRVLVFKPMSLSRIWVLDDNADPPREWESPWDGYQGNPGELYKGLEEYYWVDYFGKDESISDSVREAVERFTDIYDLDYELVARIVIETKVYNADGSFFFTTIDEPEIFDMIDSLILASSEKILTLSNNGSELYIPSNKVSLIDIPRRKYEEITE